MSAKTDAIAIPKGTTGQQPGSPVAGWLRYNTTNAGVEVYNGSSWIAVGTSGSAVDPAGMVSAFSMTGCPTGWLEANGASISTTAYPSLFVAIGYTYGGSGPNFNLPDYRGYFLRGRDHSSGNDPDVASRTNRGDGTVGDSVGTRQSFQIQNHNHQQGSESLYSNYGGGNYVGARSWGASASYDAYTYQNTSSTGGNETRPKNISVVYCISTETNSATTVASSGSGTTNYISQWTSTTALGNSPIAVSGGNVGIGTTNPGQKLSVAGTVESTSGGFRFPDGTTQTTAYAVGSSNWVTEIQTAQSTTTSMSYTNLGNITAPSLAVALGDTVAVRLSCELKHSSTGGAYVRLLMGGASSSRIWGDGDGSGPYELTISRSAASYAVVSGAQVVVMNASGTLTATPQLKQDWGGGYTGYAQNCVVGLSKIGFAGDTNYWGQSGTNISYASGNVGIGTTNPGVKLDVTGEIKIGNTSSTCNSTNEGQQRYNSTTHVMEYCNATSWTSMSGGGGGTANVQTFDSSGTWTKPGSGAMAIIECWGAGGGGGRSVTGNYGYDYSGGGGGGSYVTRNVPVSSLGGTETVTIGAGGLGGSATARGGDGGDSSFGTWVKAYGGNGGAISCYQTCTASAAGGGGGGVVGRGSGSSGGPPSIAVGGDGDGSGTIQYHGDSGYSGYSLYHGGGGSSTYNVVGGPSVYGGAGGGSTAPSGVSAGGTSSFAGNGGAASNGGTATAGGMPGGGGGASRNGTAGAGGGGRCRITVY